MLSNIYIGLVVNNKDPRKKGRVQVFIPHITNTLYTGWNDNNENIKFRTLDSDVFTPEITRRLIDVLPWAEVSMPFFGGGTGAPVNTFTGEATPTPTAPMAPTEAIESKQYDTPAGNIPKKNLNENGTVNVENLSPKIKTDMVEFTKIFPNSVITSGAEINAVHPKGSTHANGNAIDLRIRDVDDATQLKYVEWLASNGYQGIGWEGDHIHAQTTLLGGSGYGAFGTDGKMASVNTTTPAWFQDFNKRMKAGEFKTGNIIKVVGNGLNNRAGDVTTTTINSTSSEQEVSDKLKEQRKKFITELLNEDTKANFYTIIRAEVGSYSERDQTMFIESVMNRSISRNKPIDGELGYYGPNTRNALEAKKPLDPKLVSRFDKIVNDVINNGTNLSNFATGNNQRHPSDTAKYNKGFETVIGDQERFGIEGPDTEWAKKQGADLDAIAKSQDKSVKVVKQCADLNGPLFDGVVEVSNKGTSMGISSVPHIGSKAYVMFLDGNHLQPIVIGCFREPSNG